MKNECTNKEIGIRLHAYEISALNEEMTEEFEKHVLSCKSCFENLQRFENESIILKHDTCIKNEVLHASLTPHKPSWDNFRISSVILALIILIMIYPTYLGITLSTSSIRPVDSIQLVPVRSADNNYTINQSNDVVISFVYPESDPLSDYFIEISSENKLLMKIESFHNFDSYNTGRILVPKESLVPGVYRCILKDNKNKDGKILQQYTFRII